MQQIEPLTASVFALEIHEHHNVIKRKRVEGVYRCMVYLLVFTFANNALVGTTAWSINGYCKTNIRRYEVSGFTLAVENEKLNACPCNKLVAL